MMNYSVRNWERNVPHNSGPKRTSPSGHSQTRWYAERLPWTRTSGRWRACRGPWNLRRSCPSSAWSLDCRRPLQQPTNNNQSEDVDVWYYLLRVAHPLRYKHPSQFKPSQNLRSPVPQKFAQTHALVVRWHQPLSGRLSFAAEGKAN